MYDYHLLVLLLLLLVQYHLLLLILFHLLQHFLYFHHLILYCLNELLPLAFEDIILIKNYFIIS